MNRARVSANRLYDSVIERTKKTRFSSIDVSDCFMVKRLDRGSPITVSHQPTATSVMAPGDAGISIQLRLEGYCLAPLRWFRERGIDPVLMQDESRQYRETFFSVFRRWFRKVRDAIRHPREVWWGLRNPKRPRPVRVEAL